LRHQTSLLPSLRRSRLRPGTLRSSLFFHLCRSRKNASTEATPPMNKTRTRTATYVSDTVCMRFVPVALECPGQPTLSRGFIPIRPYRVPAGCIRLPRTRSASPELLRSEAARLGCRDQLIRRSLTSTNTNWDLNQPDTNQVEKVRGDQRFRRFIRNGKGND
jgi:hypothetical protein